MPLSLTDNTRVTSIHLPEVLRQLTESAVHQAARTGTGLHREVQADTINCDSGTFDYRIEIANPGSGQLVSGDSIRIIFNNCLFEGITVRGRYDLELTQTFDLDTFDDTSPCGSGCVLAVSVQYTDLRLSVGPDTLIVHGGGTLALTYYDDDRLDFYLSGVSLYIIEQGGEALLLSDFEIEAEQDNFGNTTIDADYDIAGTVLDGSIHVEASNVYIEYLQDNANSGTVTIAGANSSQLTLTIVSTTTINFELETDGSPPAELTGQIMWNDL